MSEFISKKTVKTRSRHQCFLCLDPIQVGEAAVSSVHKDGGEIYTLHAHARCHAFALEKYPGEEWGGAGWEWEVFTEEMELFYKTKKEGE